LDPTDVVCTEGSAPARRRLAETDRGDASYLIRVYAVDFDPTEPTPLPLTEAELLAQMVEARCENRRSQVAYLKCADRVAAIADTTMVTYPNQLDAIAPDSELQMTARLYKLSSASKTDGALSVAQKSLGLQLLMKKWPFSTHANSLVLTFNVTTNAVIGNVDKQMKGTWEAFFGVGDWLVNLPTSVIIDNNVNQPRSVPITIAKSGNSAIVKVTVPHFADSMAFEPNLADKAASQVSQGNTQTTDGPTTVSAAGFRAAPLAWCLVMVVAVFCM